MNMTPTSCATCGWRGVLAGAFCPSCGAQLQDTMANSGPPPANDIPHTGGRIALLALAGALLIIFLTLFVVGLALGNRDASADALSRGYADIQKWRRWRQGQAYRDADSHVDSSSTDSYSTSQYADHMRVLRIRWRQVWP